VLDFLSKASLLPVAFQAIGVNQQNQANAEAASTAYGRNVDSMREQNAWQVAQNQKAMDFSERMSSTAHQREVEDLKKAGLNPILSANAGSSAPQGTTSSGGSASAPMARMENMLDGQMLLAGMKTNAEIDYTHALTDKAKMDTKVASKSVPEADLKNKIYNKIQEAWKRMNESAAPKDSWWKKQDQNEKMNEREKKQRDLILKKLH